MSEQTASSMPVQRARSIFRRWLNRPCTPGVHHIPELNGLRVLLVFIVSWYHFWQQSWLTPHVGSTSLDFLVRAGYVPVDGTILLSGFLLFLPHARAMLLGERVPDLRGFYQKRVMRIVPSYYFVTLVMLFAVALPGLWSNANTSYADQLRWMPQAELEQLIGGTPVWGDQAALQEAYLKAWPLWKGTTPNGPAMALSERMQWVADTYQGDVLQYIKDWMGNLSAVYYGDKAAMWEDIIRHLTFTQTFDYATYISTPIGVASWTIAIEMQAYLLFPLLAWCARRKPLATFGFMMAAALGFRCWCLWSLKDYNMVVNQVINFLDVYAIGMASALLYVKLTTLWPKDRRLQLPLSAAATVIIALAFWGLIIALKAQAGTPQSGLQAGQMVRRPVFALLLAAVTLALPFALRPVRFLFGNRLMGLLAMVSMNYYLFHQNIAVYLKTRLQLPASANYPTPNMISGGPEQPWADQYMALCFGGSLLVAIAVTFLVEKPGARLLGKGFGKLNAAWDRRKSSPPRTHNS
ncbi:MAG: acyltransferase [Clostridia bacterium]|nr:acyltransferase [Clostridia bacterium]